MLGSEKNIILVRILLYRLLLNRGSTVWGILRYPEIVNLKKIKSKSKLLKI